MNLTLVRFAYTPSATLGILTVGATKLCTLERPWIPNPRGAGGLLSESCVPDGEYHVEPFSGSRPVTQDVYRLVNPALGVYASTRPVGQQWGRTGILIHVGNTVDDIIGCIAVGQSHSVNGGRAVVNRSELAMRALRQLLGTGNHSLRIRPTRGTTESPELPASTRA
jgi:hypothetical protein